MSQETQVYIKAFPKCVAIDTEAGGDRFSELIRSTVKGNETTEIVLDLSGNVRLDYWGCSRTVDTCLDILSDSLSNGRKTLTILTSLRYEDKDSYAWLFFNKCSAASAFEQAPSRSFADLAISICSKYGVQFDLFKVPLRFSYIAAETKARTPDVVLSSR
jgi:hypothetical protein